MINIDEMLERCIDSLPLPRDKLFVDDEGNYQSFVLRFENIETIKKFYRTLLELGQLCYCIGEQ